MTILAVGYGLALIALALIQVGIIQRLNRLEHDSPTAREPLPAVPDWLSSKLDGGADYHMLVVVDDACSICHRTLAHLDSMSSETPRILDDVTVLTNKGTFTSKLTIVVDEDEHRNLHPGWSPAGLVYSTSGLVDRLPVGSVDSIEYAIGRLAQLNTA